MFSAEYSILSVVNKYISCTYLCVSSPGSESILARLIEGSNGSILVLNVKPHIILETGFLVTDCVAPTV